MQSRLPLLPFLLLSFTACHTMAPAGGVAPPPDAVVYECPGHSFSARFTQEHLALWLNGEYRELPRVRSASGMRYASEGIEFFGKGREAMLTLGDTVYRNCRERESSAPG